MVATSADATKAMMATLQKHQDSMMREADFIYAIQKLQFEVNRDIALGATTTKNLFNSLFQHAEAGVVSMLERIFVKSNTAAETVDHLSSVSVIIFPSLSHMLTRR